MIKNIIFDFGGVLLNLHFQKSFAAFRELGFEAFESMFSQFAADDLFKNLETGDITPAVFYEQLKKRGSRRVTDEALRQAWNAMLGDYRVESLDFLATIRDKYRLFLLSNTNIIHYEAFSATLKQQTRYSSLESLFTKAYYSHDIHRRKPLTATYQFVLDDAGIRAAETLFIDDTITNLQPAEQLGINTHLLLPEERIEHLSF